MSAARHIKDAIAENKRLTLNLSALMDIAQSGRAVTQEELRKVMALSMMSYAHMCLADVDLGRMPQTETGDRRQPLQAFHVEHNRPLEDLVQQIPDPQGMTPRLGPSWWGRR